MLPLTAWNAGLEKAPRISGTLIDGDDRDWLELRSKFIHTQLQQLPNMAADIEPKCSKIHGSRDPFQVPPNEKGFVRREVLSKIVERGFQLWRPIGEQDHLCLFRESNEVGRTRWSPHHGLDSIAGRRQCCSAGSTKELQESPPVHQIPSMPAVFVGLPGLVRMGRERSDGPSVIGPSSEEAVVGTAQGRRRGSGGRA